MSLSNAEGRGPGFQGRTGPGQGLRWQGFRWQCLWGPLLRGLGSPAARALRGRAVRGRAMAAALAVPALLLGAGSACAAPETYTFDKSHTEVRFSWDHLGLSRQSGRFLDVDGSLQLDPEQPEASRVEVVIKLSSLSSGVKELDGVLKSKEFLDVASNPVATFRSSEVVRTGVKTARVSGELTLSGKTNPVVLDVVWNFAGEHPLSKINPVYAGLYYTGFSARTQILRSDWGLTRTIPYVSDEIRLEIEAELKRTSAPLAPVERAPLDAGSAPGPGAAGGTSGAAAPSRF